MGGRTGVKGSPAKLNQLSQDLEYLLHQTICSLDRSGISLESSLIRD